MPCAQLNDANAIAPSGVSATAVGSTKASLEDARGDAV